MVDIIEFDQRFSGEKPRNFFVDKNILCAGRYMGSNPRPTALCGIHTGDYVELCRIAFEDDIETVHIHF